MKNGTFFGLAAALSIVGPVALGIAPANAVVYCKVVGIPKGCVARPAGAAVVHPATGRVVYCTRPGYPRGCVVR